MSEFTEKQLLAIGAECTCDDFAPDTLAPDEGDGVDWTLVCTTCYWHKEEHNE